MSRNYDNWERLVAAVLKRDQIWQLCHQDSISSSIFSDDSSDLESSFRFSDVKSPTGTATPPPVSLGKISLSRTFEFAPQPPQLREGDFGTTYIALLLQDVRVSDQKCFAEGSRVAIKILETVEIGKEEFEMQVIVLGNFRHENVGQPLAYYFSKKRKLIVYDSYSQGSVSDMLHGHGRSRPDWESRLRIAVGAARGIAHIHTQRGGTLAHGNIKSSNIFLNSQNYGCVSDFGLAGIKKLKKPSQMSDVYGFGLVLLELVTRRKPFHKMVIHLINSYDSYDRPGILLSEFHGHRILVDEKEMVEYEREMFAYVDLDLNIPSVHQDLHMMLRVAKRCLVRNPERRPAMSEVVLMLENIPQSRRHPPQTKFGID